jgi:quercetin dioxygenase-like cupin family protein
VKVRKIRDVAAEAMTKPDQEGLIVRNVINKEDAGAGTMILLSSELPPGKVHLLHRHPNAEQIMYVLEGSCLALSEGEPVRLGEGDAVFIAQGEWHCVRNDTDQPTVTLVIYGGQEHSQWLATRSTLERVMNFGENPIGMRILQLTEFTAVRRFPHFQAVSDQVHNSL